jgi:zinc D-Ala-D-Ala carboxypeptidase
VKWCLVPSCSRRGDPTPARDPGSRRSRGFVGSLAPVVLVLGVLSSAGCGGCGAAKPTEAGPVAGVVAGSSSAATSLPGDRPAVPSIASAALAPSADASAASPPSGPRCDGEGLPTKLLQWVNRSRCLQPCGFHPPDLVHLPSSYLELRKEAAEGLWQMQVEASRKGISLGVRSAYRAYGTQVLTFGVWMGESSCEDAQRGSAVPGHSEHQLGDAVDFAAWDLRANKLMPGQDAVPAWLEKNACKYGWLLSYPPYDGPPPSGYIHEPWHWRFVGREVAQLVRPVVGGVCTEKYKSLEEYLQAHPSAAVSGTCDDCPNPWNATDAVRACIASTKPAAGSVPTAPSPCDSCESGCYLDGDRATDKRTGRCAATGQYARQAGTVGTTPCFRCGGPTKLGEQTIPGTSWVGGARRVVCEAAAETR